MAWCGSELAGKESLGFRHTLSVTDHGLDHAPKATIERFDEYYLSVSSSGDGRGHVPAVRTSFELLDKSLRHAALEDGRLMGLLHGGMCAICAEIAPNNCFLMALLVICRSQYLRTR